MSPHDSGVQCNFPYGCAPLQLVAGEGLRNYEFGTDADRISVKFLSTVIEKFQRDCLIFPCRRYKSTVRLRPAFLAWYSAVSAIARISCSEALAVVAVAPTLIVT